MLKVYARLSLFFAYLGIFFTFPWCFLTIPWAVAVGFCLTVFFLLFITHQFSLTLLFKLNALPLSEENEPGTFEMVHRFCRDLGITPPKLFESVHAAPNLCVFGLSPNNTYLVVTRGLLNSCSRGELGTLLSWILPASLCVLFFLCPQTSDTLAQVLWLREPSKTRILNLKIGPQYS
ncbi:MAG: hypothetical protein EB078_05130 [Proteobacteria bacterium]|nr:hypothetical protein [Pseudomonadota bacterium]